MKTNVVLLNVAIMVIVGAAARTVAGKTVLLEWDFMKASDALGWTLAEPLDVFRVSDGVLVVAPGPGIPKLESPLFEIQANPWQSVEIEMKSDTGGTGLVYYSDTTDPPYHGFRPGRFATFLATAGDQFRTYTVHPFWHRMGKIIHIRIDPPGNKIAIRAIRITDRSPGRSPIGLSPEFGGWDFRGWDCNWWELNEQTRKTSYREGVEIAGNRDAVLLSPPFVLDSSLKPWATVRFACRSERAVLFRWVSDSSESLHSAPIYAIADGRMHSYNIDLAGIEGWSGKILCVGITPTDSDEEEELTLESIALGKEPYGPPEIRIIRFAPDKPFVRAGDNTKLMLQIKNEGGRAAKDISAQARIVSGTASVPLEPRTAETLKPGEIKEFVWPLTAQEDGLVQAWTKITVRDEWAAEKIARFRVHPKLDPSAKRHKYVPEPKPADTGEYLVGVYYYPGWNSYERWSVLDDFPERRPLLGYYKEGNPEVADWHVKWALDHGISFFIYDWYWSKGARQLEHALHDGLFKSKYGDKLKFCLLWANHNPDGTSSAEDNQAVTRYWIENYFNRPNYLKIGGKNVVVIFSTHRLTSDMGSEAVKKSFDKMRKMCEDAGVGGLYLVACTHPGPGRVKTVESEGYDAMSGYNYPSAGSRGRRIAPYEWMLEGYKEWWEQLADESSLPFIPVCEPGWDARPWHGLNSIVRSGKTPALWRQMLENAKAFLDDPNRKKSYGKKLVFLEAWNEWGEGDYIEPHAEFGFDYLEAVREVFAPKSSRPTLILPQDIGLGPYEFAPTKMKTEWDFSKPDDRVWQASHLAEISYDRGVLAARSVDRDPILSGPRVRIDASKLKIFQISMKSDRDASGQVFFARRGMRMSEEKSVRFKVIGDGKLRTYEVDLSSSPYWRGIIEAIRFDPIDVEDARIEIKQIRFK